MGCMQEHIPIEEVFDQLRTSRAGLTDEEAEARAQIFGPNKLEEKSVLLLGRSALSISFRGSGRDAKYVAFLQKRVS